MTDTKEKLEVMVSNLTEQSLKLEEVAEEIEVTLCFLVHPETLSTIK